MFWVANFCLVALLVAAAFVLLRRRRLQDNVIAELSDLIGRIREGEAPIEQLDSDASQWGGVVDHIRELLQELRRKDQQLAELNAETSQRVAHRTDALQRRIGTLERQSASDPLTGMYNRRMLDETLPRLIEASKQGKSPLALLMIDLNNFKTLNDTFGHAAGDQTLRDIGGIIRSTIRDADMAFRYGGDEFVIVLPACPRQAAVRVSLRLQSLTQSLAAGLKLPSDRPLGLSIGICMMDELLDPTAEIMLRCADELLYEMKKERKTKARQLEKIAH
jgi:diguanylate cyclase (GGDEF)-like protein